MVDDFDRQFRRIVNNHMAEVHDELQSKVNLLDRKLRHSVGGRPVKIVEPVVQQELEELGITLSPGRLRQYSKSLSDRMSVGIKIEVEDIDHLNM